jgi:hypothetical protein
MMKGLWVCCIVTAAAAALAGCSVQKMQYALAAKPGAAIPDLVDKSDAELAEIAVRDLMGEGNVIAEARSDPREAPRQVPQPRWGWVEHRYLAEKLYTPLTWESARDPRRRQLQLAWCEWQIQSGEVEWSKTPGEALDTGACRGDVRGDTIANEPLLKYALARVLLEGHVRREQLLDQMRWHLIQTLGGKPTRICFDTNGHNPALIKVEDGCYVGLWQPPSRHDGFTTVRTHLYAPTRFEDRSPRHLAQTSALLLGLTLNSPHHAEAPELLSRISSIQTWKAAEKIWPLEGDTYLRVDVLEKSITVLQQLPKESHLFADAQARIKLGQQRIKDIKADLARQEKERKQAEARAAAEERRFIASLGPGQKRVFNELGYPTSEEPAPGGGRVWRYEEPVHSNLRDRWGSAIIIGYRWREYTFDSAGNLRKRGTGAN